MNSLESRLRSLSFKKKLVLSFSLMLSLTFILGAALLSSLYELKRQAEDYEHLRASYEIMTESGQIFAKMRRALDGYLIGSASDRWTMTERASILSPAT